MAGGRAILEASGGMTPALEIMINTATVKKLIEENRLDKLTAAIETGSDDGMLTFNQSLFNLVKAGRVTEKEALGRLSPASVRALELAGDPITARLTRAPGNGAPIGLQHVIDVELVVAARHGQRGRFPGRLSSGQLVFRNQQIDLAVPD